MGTGAACPRRSERHRSPRATPAPRDAWLRVKVTSLTMGVQRFFPFRSVVRLDRHCSFGCGEDETLLALGQYNLLPYRIGLAAQDRGDAPVGSHRSLTVRQMARTPHELSSAQEMAAYLRLLLSPGYTILDVLLTSR